MQEVDKLIASSTIYITKERDTCNSIAESLLCLSKAVNEVCNKSSKLLFIALEKYQQQIKDFELFIKESKNTHDYGIQFAPSIDFEKYLFQLTGLGKVVHPNKVILLQKKSEKMSLSGSFYAICELPTRETLVLDYGNNKVTLLDNKYQCLSCLSGLSSYSYEMCLISSSEVVVTMNENYKDDGLHCLQMINTKNGRLEMGRKLQLNHRCVGIAHHKDDLYVTSGTALYQYTLTGTLVKKLYEDKTNSNTGSGQILLYYSNNDAHI
ncbi:hypothetical protein DPMN_184467 [Dreissena polymorpha]|uniref:Uncharacterized protein n=1 Tax=Dreissena polymorpha TaxID=45954 RepID=A0A9D4I4M1_DREPO|nr:hypothetical protein DPMN_184467 [Dreissena polymorpha]